jgi:nicotinamide-nucleotide amidase
VVDAAVQQAAVAAEAHASRLSGMPPHAADPIATAELLAVGAELLVGETRDTNSGDLALALTDLGVEVVRMSQLPDDLEIVTAAVRDALERVDLVITTGGLGPTPDDLTRESIAAAIGEELAVDPGLEAWLRDTWARRDLPFSEVNLKQAWLIPSASAMGNPHGTAPGWWIEHAGRIVIALPGPPRELRPMWKERALPRLRERGLGLDRAAETLRLTGIGESMVVDLIGKELLERENPRIATYARADAVDVRISAVATGSQSASALVEASVASLSPRIDPYVFARGDDDWSVALGGRIGTQRLATAEIGTAGYLGLLLGTAQFLLGAEQRHDRHAEASWLANDIRLRLGADIGLAVVAHETDEDMRVEVALDISGHVTTATSTVFRGGDTGRRRAANAAAAELWRRLGS